MTYTVRIDEIGKDDLALAGGKGANLGELSRTGLPVPPGFVVTTGAYDAFVEASGWRGDRRPRCTTRDGRCERVRGCGRGDSGALLGWGGA
jgi:phosphoenolpyruvate synthase/pyruvate phosphate dikinase